MYLSLLTVALSTPSHYTLRLIRNIFTCQSLTTLYCFVLLLKSPSNTQSIVHKLLIATTYFTPVSIDLLLITVMIVYLFMIIIFLPDI